MHTPHELPRHPQANRACRMADTEVAYQFQRARRKTIGLLINEQGLSVRAPLWVPEAEVQGFLLSKTQWVLSKLRALRSRPAVQAQDWRHGSSIQVLGRALTLNLDPGHSFAGADAAQVGSFLCLALPPDCAAQRLRDTVVSWLIEQARSRLTNRLDHFAPCLGVRWSRLRLSSARTRWGSAHAGGAINLNWRLIQLRPQLIDYVVVHELCHLREMNHSPAFWRLVEQVLPDHVQLRRELLGVRLPPLTPR